MRLHVFVPCGCGAALLGDDPVSSQNTVDSPPPDPETDFPLSPEPRSTAAAEKHRRKTTSQSGSTTSWRPSLRAISEDGSPQPAAAGVPKRAARVARSRSKVTTSRSRTPSRTEPKDSREYGVPILMPAFTPTAFMF